MTTSSTTRFASLSPSAESSTSFDGPTSVSELSPEISDEILLARIGHSDKESLACLFHRYARLVRTIGQRILKDNSEADDLVQELFLFIHQKSKVFDSSKSSARSWIVQMAYQRAIDRRRYLDSRHFYTRLNVSDLGESLAGSASRGRYQESIDDILRRIGPRGVFGVLSEKQREVLGLYLVDGYTFEEIAVKLRQTRGNVKNLYFRGLEKLRNHIFGSKRRDD